MKKLVHHNKMLTRWFALAFFVAALAACSDSDLNIPDHNSLGVSQPLIEIYAPAGDAILPANTPFTLDYAILRSPDGHHIKIHIDKQKPQIVVRRSGKHQIHGLPAGTHRIQIVEYTQKGVETGGTITLNVTMQDSPPHTAPAP